MSKQNFDSEELAKLFHKIHQKLDWLTCAIKECCSKIPINIGDGVGLFKRLANNKWEFKSLVEGDNITITETTEEIIISSQATPFSCEDVNECLGISDAGESNKFLNEQGDFVTVSGFTCSDLSTCSTSNLQEGSRLYFTNGRAVTALTGQNISLFTNNSGFITSSALSPYLTITSAASTYQPIGSYLTSISGLNISQLNNDSGYITEAIADTKYYSITNPSSFITSSALTPYLLSSTASSTYEPIITPGTISQYYRGDKTFQTLDKSTIGLSNVDNTSDSSKPISIATQAALDLKANISAQRSGAVIAFDTDANYGTIASPLTGNITGNYTGAIIGVVQLLIHNDSVAPTIPATWIKANTSASYTTGVVNFIAITWLSSNIATYTIWKSV